MGTVSINTINPAPSISVEHGDRLFWLGRYTERVFTTLKALEKLSDEAIDKNPDVYTDYLDAFGLPDDYGSGTEFFRSFIFDKANQSSAAFALECAYDNGIVLREEISTEALSFLQMAKDILAASEKTERSLRLSLLPLEDILYGFWGCIVDNVHDAETKNIIQCGKSIERLDLYFRLKYPFGMINDEFERLCRHLRGVPKNTPYRYNTKQLSTLVEIMGEGEDYAKCIPSALYSLQHMFVKERL